jgi:UDP:flavonoid glycosyltransferase YjiC (YdhE family)
MAAVIHHGGAGTTASCAVSGVPQIIVPHILDPYYWGHRIYRSHLGPKPIWRSKLSPTKLAMAIRECLSNPSVKEKAIETQKKIKPHESLRRAVRYVAATDKMT